MPTAWVPVTRAELARFLHALDREPLKVNGCVVVQHYRTTEGSAPATRGR